MKKTLFKPLLEYVEKSVLPQRMIEMARGDHAKMPSKDTELVQRKMQQFDVQPGDIILVKTPSVFYEAIRKLYSTEHDHAILVVDSERCLHITYPKARLVPVHQFLHPSRAPVLIKITQQGLSANDRARFISTVKHASVGKQYDSQRLFEFFRLSMPSKLGIQASLFGSAVVQKARNMGLGLPNALAQNEDSRSEQAIVILEALQRSEKETQKKKSGKASDKVICSDLIFKHLSCFIPQLSHAVLHDEKGLLGDLDYHVNGWVSPKDFSRIVAVHSPKYFLKISMHGNEAESEANITAQPEKEVTYLEDKKQSWGDKIQLQLLSATDSLRRGALAIRALQDKYKSEEVRDQVEFLMSVYRSATLLVWTLNELSALRKQQNFSDKIVNVSKALTDASQILNLVSDFGSLAFTKGLLFGPMSSLFLNLARQRANSKAQTFSWKLRMVLTINFLKRFVAKYNQMARFRL